MQGGFPRPVRWRTGPVPWGLMRSLGKSCCEEFLTCEVQQGCFLALVGQVLAHRDRWVARDGDFPHPEGGSLGLEGWG